MAILTTSSIFAAGQRVRILHAARNVASSRRLLLSLTIRIARCVLHALHFTRIALRLQFDYQGFATEAPTLQRRHTLDCPRFSH